MAVPDEPRETSMETLRELGGDLSASPRSDIGISGRISALRLVLI
jgi:hypothetical protein